MLRHLDVSITAEILSPPGSNDIDRTTQWLKELIEAINMKILLGPHFVYCDMPGNRGLTGIVAIETSSITCHIWDECKPGKLFLDIYSCSSIDLDIIWNKLLYFNPTIVDYHFIDKDAPGPKKIQVLEEGIVTYEGDKYRWFN